MKTFSVARIQILSEYCEIEAETEEDAIEKAQEIEDEYWEEDPNMSVRPYDYSAEEVTD